MENGIFYDQKYIFLNCLNYVYHVWCHKIMGNCNSVTNLLLRNWGWKHLWAGNRAWKSQNHDIMYTTFHFRNLIHIQTILLMALNKDFLPEQRSYGSNRSSESSILENAPLKPSIFTPRWSISGEMESMMLRTISKQQKKRNLVLKR